MLAVTGRTPVAISEDHIPIGSDPCCAIVFPDAVDIKPIHAVIKEISGRWLVESCDTDLIRVGNSEPGRRHWLKPGDVIQLSADGPTITFEPKNEAHDDLLPDIPRLANSSPPPRPSKPVAPLAPLSDDACLADTVDIATPSTSTSIPVVQAPKSGTIRTAPPRSSDEVPVLKRMSQPVKPEKGQKTGSTAARSSKSDSEIPARRTKRPASSGQIPTRKPTDEEFERELPVLTRGTSFGYEEEELAPAPRRGRSSEKAEMDWIMNMILRCVGSGVVLLIVWMLIGSLWKMLSQPDAGIPDASTSTTTTPTTAAVTTVTSTPSTETVPRPISKPAAPATVDAPKIDKTKSESAKTEHAEDASAPEETKETAFGEPDENDPDSSEAMASKTDEAAAEDSSESEMTGDLEGEQSPILEAVVNSLYAVVMQDASGTKQVHLGTAWAASDRHLVTTGTIGTEMKKLQKKGFIAMALQPSKDWAMRIKDAKIHPKYIKAVSDAAGKHNEKQLAHIQMQQLRHDLAVLELDPAHDMDQMLPFVIRPLKTTTETSYSIVGFPPLTYSSLPPVFAEVSTIQENRSKRMAPVGINRSKEPVINIKFPPQVQERNWSGSPVLNKDNQVIGTYALMPSQGSSAGKNDKAEYVVVWLGLLKEITTDVFRKSDQNPAMDDDR